MMLVIPIFIVHRGCPHDCLFCNQRHIAGRGIQHGEVRKTIIEWLNRESKHKPEKVQIAFFGGSFTCLPFIEMEQLIGEVQPFLQDGSVDSVRCSTRPDCITPELCQFLVQNGVTTVELGVQSMSDSVLQSSHRGHNVKQSEQAIGILQDFGIKVGVQLMVGLPDSQQKSGREGIKTFLRGLRRLLALQPNMIRLYPALVLEGTALADLYFQEKYQPFDFDTIVTICAIAIRLCEKAGVTVIRVGLQQSERLEETIIAGAWHPAFGEMVRSRLWLYQMRKILYHTKGKNITFLVSHRDISAVVGIKQKNKKQLDCDGYGGRYTIAAKRSIEKGTLDYVVNKQS